MLNKPRNIKYSKVQRGKLPRIEMSSYNLKFGSLGLMALERGFLNYNQLEACRKVINRTIKRKGKIWIRVFPDYPFSAKPIGVRMGKGKGRVDLWVARVCKGKILFELDGVSLAIGQKALISASKKLPLKVVLIKDNL